MLVLSKVESSLRLLLSLVLGLCLEKVALSLEGAGKTLGFRLAPGLRGEVV